MSAARRSLQPASLCRRFTQKVGGISIRGPPQPFTISEWCARYQAAQRRRAMRAKHIPKILLHRGWDAHPGRSRAWERGPPQCRMHCMQCRSRARRREPRFGAAPRIGPWGVVRPCGRAPGAGSGRLRDSLPVLLTMQSMNRRFSWLTTIEVTVSNLP